MFTNKGSISESGKVCQVGAKIQKEQWNNKWNQKAGKKKEGKKSS